MPPIVIFNKLIALAEEVESKKPASGVRRATLRRYAQPDVSASRLRNGRALRKTGKSYSVLGLQGREGRRPANRLAQSDEIAPCSLRTYAKLYESE